MYTFNRIDSRLDKLCELSAFLFDAFDGIESQFTYAITAHSGSGPEALTLVPWGRPPASPKEKLALCEQLRAHAQYCNPGDQTLEATRLAIADCLSEDADEHFVFVVSDADLERYGISPAEWTKIIMSNKRCHVYAILLSQNETEAARLIGGIAPGHAYVCEHTDQLAPTFMQILQHAML